MKAPVIRDSGERELMPTGSQRDSNKGKGRLDLVLLGVPFALKAVSRHFEEGAVKYNEHNWLKGQKLTRYYQSAMNHLVAFGQGETTEPHIVAAICNLLCLLETYFLIKIGRLPKELNDLIVPVVVYDDVIDPECEYDRVIPTDDYPSWVSRYWSPVSVGSNTEEEVKVGGTD